MDKPFCQLMNEDQRMTVVEDEVSHARLGRGVHRFRPQAEGLRLPVGREQGSAAIDFERVRI